MKLIILFILVLSKICSKTTAKYKHRNRNRLK